MEAVCSTETSVNFYQTTRPNIQEGSARQDTFCYVMGRVGTPMEKTIILRVLLCKTCVSYTSVIRQNLNFK
jgi:hypothetical protein